MTLNFLPVANVDPDLGTHEAMQERIYELERLNRDLERHNRELRVNIR
jgi:hypothetical protein